MKAYLVGLILLAPSMVVAQANGLCLPQAAPAESKGWPVCAIYMHGLFGGNPYPIKAWELPMRKSLEKVALAKKCKIAVPIGNKGTWNNWNSVSLPEMRKRASAVCRGAKMERPALIAFSNGANVVRKNGAASCQSIAGHSKVTMIGPSVEGSQRNKAALACGNTAFIQKHAVPSLDALMRAVPYQSAKRSTPSRTEIVSRSRSTIY